MLLIALIYTYLQGSRHLITNASVFFCINVFNSPFMAIFVLPVEIYEGRKLIDLDRLLQPGEIYCVDGLLYEWQVVPDVARRD